MNMLDRLERIIEPYFNYQIEAMEIQLEEKIIDLETSMKVIDIKQQVLNYYYIGKVKEYWQLENIITNLLRVNVNISGLQGVEIYNYAKKLVKK